MAKKTTKSRILTEPYVKALKPAPRGKRYAIPDALVPGLKVRVTETGAKSYVLWRRYAGAKNPAARFLGQVGPMTLADARKKAQKWLVQLAQGEDPKQVERREREAKEGEKAVTFSAVFEVYLTRHVKKMRRGHDVEREMRTDLLSRWKDKPLSEIKRPDVIRMVDQVALRGPYQAHNLLGHTKTFFNWAIEHDYVETSPTDRIKPGRLIGPRSPRQRVLSDAEIKQFWRGASVLGYPFGTLFQMLLLTGQRRSEIAEARWHEIDLRERVLVVPPERFKSDSSHIVPLTGDVIALLEKLPRWNAGDALFSTTSGQKPVNGFSYQKRSLDSFMKGALGDVVVKPWVIHDLRRTMRTRLSSLKVPDPVAEMIIGHGRKGIQRVYDQHAYLEEMRDALEAWNARLREIVS